MCSRYCVCESKTSPGNKIVMAESYKTCLEESMGAKEQKGIFPRSVNAEMETRGRVFLKPSRDDLRVGDRNRIVSSVSKHFCYQHP